MEWFKDFYENDYFQYRYAPRLDEIPTQEVDFLLRHGIATQQNTPLHPRIFDICCGVGRHSRPMALTGAQVTGVDIAGANIQAANKLAAEQNISELCQFDQADIREYAVPKNCDLAMNIFTSFGYFGSEQADSIIMKCASESLKPGGRFILDIANREKIIAEPPQKERRGTDENYVIDEPSLDISKSKLICCWNFFRDGKSSSHTIELRLYCLHELIAMADSFDMKFIQAFGDFDSSEYTAKSRRCIFVAEKQ